MTRDELTRARLAPVAVVWFRIRGGHAWAEYFPEARGDGWSTSAERWREFKRALRPFCTYWRERPLVKVL